MYNGSLTHILLIYEKIRNFVFYLSCKYDNWNFKLNLYKLAILAGMEKEIKGIQDSYPEVLNNLTSDEAESIMDLCLNHPIKYKRLSSQWLAFGAIGYFLSDECFEYQEKSIVSEMESWLSNHDAAISIGQGIFKYLSGVAYRMPQDTLSGICCQFMEKHYIRWYTEMFKLIANRIDLGENFDDYICITDITKAKVGESRGADVAKSWMRNRATLEFCDTFVLSVSEWIKNNYYIQTDFALAG